MNVQGLVGVGAFRSIETGVARLLAGQEPTAARLSVPTLYGVLAAVRVFDGMIGATSHEIFLLVPDVIGWLWAVCSVLALTGLARGLVAVRASTGRPSIERARRPHRVESTGYVASPR